MKEYICKEVQTENGGYLEIEKELIRCRDCVWYGGDDDWSTCATTPEYLVPPNGYCHRAEPKENGCQQSVN